MKKDKITLCQRERSPGLPGNVPTQVPQMVGLTRVTVDAKITDERSMQFKQSNHEFESSPDHPNCICRSE